MGKRAAIDSGKEDPMATATHFITEEQYLKMDTHAEYFDGRLIEQPMTGMTHGTWCEAIMHYLRGIGLRGIPEITTHVAAGQWRLPDVLVLRPDAPEEEYPTHPPLIVFEVLSPGQDMEEMLIKLNAYEAMGVSLILVVSPKTRTWRRFSEGNLHMVTGTVTCKNSALADDLNLDLDAIDNLVH